MVTGTVIAAVAVTDRAMYDGVSLWLSGTSHVHAEAAAVSGAVSAGDPAVTALVLAGRRTGGIRADHVTPCGACRQLLVDLSVYSGQPLTVYAPTGTDDRVLILPGAELLPHAFVSHHLRQACT
jgi:cytidine deaminase